HCRVVLSVPADLSKSVLTVSLIIGNVEFVLAGVADVTNQIRVPVVSEISERNRLCVVPERVVNVVRVTGRPLNDSTLPLLGPDTAGLTPVRRVVVHTPYIVVLKAHFHNRVDLSNWHLP